MIGLSRLRWTWAVLLGLAGSIGATGSLRAGPIITAGDYEGVTTDQFDVNQGAVVTAFSPQVTGSDPRGALGYVNTTFVEPLNTIFSDDHAAGFTDFIEFRLPRAIDLTSIRLGLNQDGSSPFRSASSFNLLASRDGTDFTSISSTTIAPNYLDSYGDDHITISDTLDVRDVQYFRLELVQATTGGVRVNELDGFGTASIPEPTGMVMLATGGLGLLVLGRRHRRSA